MPRLLSNIFGYDQTVGWMLNSLHPTANRENYKAVLGFLDVNGPLFRLIHRLEVEGDIYEFPISHLPVCVLGIVHACVFINVCVCVHVCVCVCVCV